ncbi:MAG: CarD family transcriptional regulator, partial [Lachnospiraceae bacterium]|nr:CarD family transcriptional regulator [Lachnospiraceae bacterium]
RYAMSGEEARALIEEMTSVETLWIPDERAREHLYKEALLSMDCRNWVKIIKTLYFRKLDRQARGQKVTVRDEYYLRRAEDRLYGELALALGRNKEEMEGYILEQIEGRTVKNQMED